MLRTSESPKDDDESSLSLASILEPASESLVPYYLSQKAAQGILRRADVRGKTLPERLRKALMSISSEHPQDETVSTSATESVRLSSDLWEQVETTSPS